jgi:hypothetical protein
MQPIPLRARLAIFAVPLVLVALLPAQKHEELGRMWPFENLPMEFFKDEYGFEPSQQWLDHARLASLRFGNGCSASFVSPQGLILTNHHCARGHVASLSPPGQDWLEDGWFAKKLADEVKIPGLTVQQLVGMVDVTARMNAASGDDGGDAILAEFKQKAPELTHQLVSLYQGGMYQVYSYRIFDDIRLVATPQIQMAKFGGDPDNFTYPRFGLDYALVRAWENDKPADSAGFYFRWKTAGPVEGETVFVTGNPGSTGRLNTVAQMEFMRDFVYPPQVAQAEGMLKQMDEVAARDPERAKQQIARRLSVENTRKALQGYLDGLRNERVMNVKREAEARIRARIDEDPKLKASYGDAFAKLEELCAKKAELAREGASRGDLRELQKQEAELAKKVGEAFFAVYGTEIPPDATFTLRLSDGVVKTFPCNGTIAPWFTSLYGLYARHTEFGGKDPFNLPQNWIDLRDKLDLTTPFNLVATADIIGGNSGSPLIDKDLNVVGLVFDGNIEMLANRFVFTDEVARSVSVHPAIIILSLRKVYDANGIADELEGKD